LTTMKAKGILSPSDAPLIAQVEGFIAGLPK
jgi:hypothetical protein